MAWRLNALQQVGEGGAYAEVGQGGGFASTTTNRMMIVQRNDPAIEAALAKKRSM
jgi:hypothetical protein